MCCGWTTRHDRTLAAVNRQEGGRFGGAAIGAPGAARVERTADGRINQIGWSTFDGHQLAARLAVEARNGAQQANGIRMAWLGEEVVGGA